jgi:hypothetical protein
MGCEKDARIRLIGCEEDARFRLLARQFRRRMVGARRMASLMECYKRMSGLV